MVTFTLVPGGTTNRCLWMRLRYRLVLRTGALRALGTGWCSSMGYFKRKISIFPSDVMVGNMVRKAHARQEILSSNPGQSFLLKIQPQAPILLPGNYWYGYRVPVQKPVPKAHTNRCLQVFFPVVMVPASCLYICLVFVGPNIYCILAHSLVMRLWLLDLCRSFPGSF